MDSSDNLGRGGVLAAAHQRPSKSFVDDQLLLNTYMTVDLEGKKWNQNAKVSDWMRQENGVQRPSHPPIHLLHTKLTVPASCTYIYVWSSMSYWTSTSTIMIALPFKIMWTKSSIADFGRLFFESRPNISQLTSAKKLIHQFFYMRVTTLKLWNVRSG